MAGVPGFEPGNAGIKNRCLTAWRYPNTAENRKIEEIWLGYLDSNQGMPVSKTGALPLGDTPIPRRTAKSKKYGWGTWIRTRECRYQKPVPYRLAIPQYRGEPQNRRNMAGVPGFEPGNAGIKNRCLTAWRYPIRATLTREWCGRRDLNSHTLRRQNLNLVRLPISPLPQKKMVATTGFEPVTPSL